MSAVCLLFFFCKQKTAYEMRISDWSSDVCSSDLLIDELKVAHFRLCPPDPDRTTHLRWLQQDIELILPPVQSCRPGPVVIADVIPLPSVRNGLRSHPALVPNHPS